MSFDFVLVWQLYLLVCNRKVCVVPPGLFNCSYLNNWKINNTAWCSHAVFKNFFVNYETNLLKYEHNFNTAKKLTPRANPVEISHAVFKNFFVNYEINLLKYEHNFHRARLDIGIKRLNSFTRLTPRANPVKITSSCKQQQQSIF
jgi:hypothetical protein